MNNGKEEYYHSAGRQRGALAESKSAKDYRTPEEMAAVIIRREEDLEMKDAIKKAIKSFEGTRGTARGGKMNIGEATKAAIEVGGWMCREEENWKLCVKPTNGFDCCKVMTIDPEGNKKPAERKWSPRAKDLMAENWEVSSELSDE